MQTPKKIPIIVLSLVATLCLLIQTTATSFGQAVRRQIKQQRQAEKKLNKQSPNQTEPTDKPADASTAQTQPQKHSLDGISQQGPRAMFKPYEAAMMIPGFGNPAAMMILMRQLDLTEEQKAKFRALKQQIGPKLTNLQNEKRMAEAQLEDAIYGENFDPQRVEELAAKSAEKTSEIIKAQAFIESQFRQILTPDQFYVFRFLVGEMVLPQRRLNPQQIRQQMQRRPGLQPNGVRPPERE
ncbi:MAG: Spy/CpxP family protein refolding chaperone [Blastocatellia bacterium]